MSYTRRINTREPSDNRPGAQFDDVQREIRLEISERMDTIVGNWSADPIASVAASFYMMLHWSAFKPPYIFSQLGGAATANDYAALTNYGMSQYGGGAGGVEYNANIPMMPGCTLVDVFASFVSVVTSTFTLKVLETSSPLVANVTQTALASRTVAGVSAQNNLSISTGAGINTVMSASKLYSVYVKIVPAAGVSAHGFQGVNIQYTRPPLNYV